MGIGRHYIIRRDITTKLYIVHCGYVIEVIVKFCDNWVGYSRSKMRQTTMHIYFFKYCANTWKIELDRAGQKCVKQRYID